MQLACNSAMHDTLVLQGIIYPPAQFGLGERTVGHLCEEFEVEELKSQLEHIRGLPIAIEHDVSKLIGEVTSAELTHSGAVQVTAVVSASTEAGRRAIKEIREKRMTGLSLSHEYKLFAKDGCALQIVLDSTGDWRNMIHKEGESVAIKHMRELSVCREPARAGCNIHDLPGMRSMSGLVNACKLGLAQQVKIDINEKTQSSGYKGTNRDKLCLSLWNIVTKSANMETPLQPNESPPDMAKQSTNVVMPLNPDMSVANPVIPPGECDATKTYLSSSGDKPNEENIGALPVDKRGEEERKYIEEGDQIETTLHGASEAVLESHRQMTAMRAEMQAMQDKLQETKNNENQLKSKLREIEEAKALQTRLSTQAALKRLQEVMSSNTNIQYDDKDPTFAAKLAIDAVKTIDDLKIKGEKASRATIAAKRCHEDTLGALAPFGGIAGRVDASAKTQRVEHANDVKSNNNSNEDHFRQWMQNNRGITWHEAKNQWGIAQPQANAQGVVNASSATWSSNAMFNGSQLPVVPLSAVQVQPELYYEMSKLMTGKMPSHSQVSELCKQSDLRITGPYR
jgi:hypothetical protein